MIEKLNLEDPFKYPTGVFSWKGWVECLVILWEKFNLLADHLNTQEERMYVEWNESMGQYCTVNPTASNQSNTEPKIPSPSDSNTKITVKCKLCGKERDGIHLTCNCPRTISLDSELPQKIRLLADFAGYPAGDEFFMYEDFYRAIDDGKYNPIHPDIIKATSWQGIRSEVTDGEESLSRTKEYTTCYGIDCPWCKHCEPSTPQTEPIESQIEEENIY